MINIKYVIFIELFLATFYAQAYVPAEGQINASFGAHVFKTHYDTPKTRLDDRLSASPAIILTGDISKKGALEIAVFNYQKTYYRELADRLIAVKTGTVHITMGYRWWLHSRFSTSMGLYSAYSFGKPNTAFSDLAPGETLKTSAEDTTEYGIDFAAQADILTVRSATLNADLRYSYSLTNKSDEFGNHYGVFLGLRFPIKDNEK